MLNVLDPAGPGGTAIEADARRVSLRLYVAGASRRSERAIASVLGFRDARLAGRCDLEVIDVLDDPDSAARDRVVAVPALVRLLPLPPRRLHGDLSDAARLLDDLDAATPGLLERLRDAEETVEAIRHDGIDTVVVNVAGGVRLRPLDRDDRTYLRLIDQMDDAALTLTAEGVILFSNRRLADWLRLPRRKVLGGKLAQFVAPEQAPALLALLAAGEGRAAFALERADRSRMPVALSLTRAGGGPPRRMLATLVDASERRETEAPARDARGQSGAAGALRERAETTPRQARPIEAAGQLSGDIAHDFNNLLQSMISQLELLQIRVGDDPRSEAQIEQVIESAQLAAGLTRQMLACSSRRTLSPAEIDIGAPGERAAIIPRRTLALAITVETDRAGALAAFADPVQREFRRLNLALNARDAMPGGGSPGIEARLIHVAEQDAAGLPEERRHVSIAVQDSAEGSGLGLATVVGFARESGGDARISGEPDREARDDIPLPPAATLRPPDGPAAGLDALPRGGGRVLIVDDAQDVLTTLAKHLREAGFEVMAASSGEAALHILSGHLPLAALVSDYAMPGVSGTELLRRAARLRPGLPALIVTGHQHDAIADLPEGVEVLRKPFTRRALIERIEALMAP